MAACKSVIEGLLREKSQPSGWAVWASNAWTEKEEDLDEYSECHNLKNANSFK